MKYLSKILYSIVLTMPMIAMAGPLVNINEADSFEMTKDLIGVTNETAESIVEYREKNGKFESLEDVLKVEGIERDFLNLNRDYIHLGNDPRVKSSS